MDNIEWSEELIKKYAPSFKHRWDIYTEIVRNSLDANRIWIDCGCGSDDMVYSYGKFAKLAVGVDLIDTIANENFVRADIKRLPFHTNSVDLITLRFVVEHFRNQNIYLSELLSTLKKDGEIIILTTNLLSPIIFIPRMLLPYSFKNKILTKIFKVRNDDVFPTFHKLNTLRKFKGLGEDFEIKKIQFISDLNYTRKLIFLLLLTWHIITEPKSLNKFRTNILIVLRKI